MKRTITALLASLCGLAAQQPETPGGGSPIPVAVNAGLPYSGEFDRDRSDATAEIAQFHEILRRAGELMQSGRYHELRRHFEQLRHRAEKLGPANEALALDWTGFTYSVLGRLADAERMLRRCLELRERVWGNANQADPNHARILTGLAGVYLELHQYQQAEKRLDEALTIWRRIPESQQDPEFAVYFNNLGMLRYSQGQYSEAARCLREAVTTAEQAVPRDERRLAQSTAFLAGALSRLNLHTEADALSTRALAAFDGRLEQEPIMGSELLWVRAFVLRRAKRGREAKRFEALARELQRQTEAYHVIDVSRMGARRRP